MSHTNIRRTKDFFDRDARSRDEEFSSNRILGYEQDARQEAILSLIKNNYALGLDAGCGNGRDFNMLLQHTQTIIGIDSSQGMVAEARIKADRTLNGQRIHLSIADVTRLPFQNGSFDFIVCSEVLEHVPNWRKALLEFCRLLKPGSTLIISTPNKLSMYGLTRYPGRLLLGSKHPYDKWKSYFELRSALEISGFEVTGTRGSCYLPGDISYYQPFKWVISHLLNFARLLEKTLSGRQPFKLLGYGIVIKCEKRHC